MKLSRRTYLLPGAVSLLVCGLAVSGCHNQTAHPDEKAAVKDSLKNNNLGSVDVWQDRDKGVMTLKGNVDSDAAKMQAESLAKQAAPDYTVADEIGVRPAGDSDAGSVASKRDSAIEDNFEASLKEHKNLNDQSIHCAAKNGTLVLKGTVKTSAQKREAESLAKKVPDVQQVVNEIEVKPDKHSTSNS
ncbi:MAG TPA: BON domain-containing protein [Terracidiphilus sp.]|nr:BON domain-containing protein [Terracidiphilus sp.]